MKACELCGEYKPLVMYSGHVETTYKCGACGHIWMESKEDE